MRCCYFSSGNCLAQYWLVAGCFNMHVNSQALCARHLDTMTAMLRRGAYCPNCGNAVEEWLIEGI